MKDFGKRGSQVGIIISFTLFILFLLSIFLLINPFLKEKGEKQSVLDSLHQNILENVEFRPDPVFVIDICKADDGNFYLLEIGSFSCAGLYACNLEKIVSAVSKAAIEEYCQFHTEIGNEL